MKMDSYFIHNSFDENQFNALLNASIILKRYESSTSYFIMDFHAFAFDLFLMVYKVVLIDCETNASNLDRLLVKHIRTLPEINRIRLRTAGSKSNAYIVLKHLLDMVLEKTRGLRPELIDEMRSLADSFDPLKPVSEGAEMTSAPQNTAAEQTDGTNLEEWLNMLTPDNVKQILTSDEVLAIESLLHLNSESPQNNNGSDFTSAVLSFTKDLLLELVKHESLDAFSQYHDAIQTVLKDRPHHDEVTPIRELIETLQEKLSSLMMPDDGPIQSPDDGPDKSPDDGPDKSPDDGPDKSPEDGPNMSANEISDTTQPNTNDNVKACTSVNVNQATNLEDDNLTGLANNTNQSDEASETLEDRLKKTFEERFSPFIKQEYMIKGNHLPQSPENISPLDNETQAQTAVYQSGYNNKAPSVQLFKSAKSPHMSSGKLANRVTDTYHEKINSILDKLNFTHALNDILEEIDVFNDQVKTLGIEKGTVDEMPFDDVISLYKRVKSPSFIKFINQVGRQKKFAHKIQASKHKHKTIPIDKVAYSNNIDLLITDEFINLSLDIDAFENDFYDRYLNDALLTIKMVGKSAKHKGPIILCYDGSGSMEGIKIEETRSHILSIIEIAKLQKRELKLIQFASASEPLYLKEINPLRVSAKDVLDILDTFICGGTDFEKPLAKAVEFILKEPHKNSDILFITDGQCEIRSKFKKGFLELKKTHRFKLYTIIMHSYTYHDYGDIGDISDEVLEIKEKHWNMETNQKLFTLL